MKKLREQAEIVSDQAENSLILFSHERHGHKSMAQAHGTLGELPAQTEARIRDLPQTC